MKPQIFLNWLTWSMTALTLSIVGPSSAEADFPKTSTDVDPGIVRCVLVGPMAANRKVGRSASPFAAGLVDLRLAREKSRLLLGIADLDFGLWTSDRRGEAERSHSIVLDPDARAKDVPVQKPGFQVSVPVLSSEMGAGEEDTTDFREGRAILTGEIRRDRVEARLRLVVPVSRPGFQSVFESRLLCRAKWPSAAITLEFENDAGPYPVDV